MKSGKFIPIVGLTLMLFTPCGGQDTLFFEDFNDYPGSKPPGWTTENETGGSKWTFLNGGGTRNPETPSSRQPYPAYSEPVNALYYYESLGGEHVFLITPPINLEFAVKPEIKFRHAQREKTGFGTANDELAIYYKTHADSTWVESKKLAEYTDEVYNWTEQTVLLPDGAHVQECYIGFKATTRDGFGVCIDDVIVAETGVQVRHVDTVIIEQESTGLVPTGTRNNPILRIEISVKGNTGDVTLNSIDMGSLNTLDSDISADGVRLFQNFGKKNFYAATELDSASFVSGEAVFSTLDYNLITGKTYFWISYDVSDLAVHGNYIDGMISAGGINIAGSTYPDNDANPAGNRLIQESVFFDDFSTDKGWVVDGDFERNSPRGLGGNYLGNPDPRYAAGDTMILGNDLTGLGFNKGDYEPLIARYGNLATSPGFDLTYYNDVKLNFMRWLNVANNDTASIELSMDNGASWTEIWSNNNNIFTDGEWNDFSLDINTATRKSQVKVRFNLGPTTLTDHFSGWNIENLAVTGNHIDYDVGATKLLAPGPGCGHSAAEDVSIRVRNFGPAASPPNIPVRYSFDGGSTFSYDTINSAIAFNSETDFVFADKIDLSEPGMYNILIETVLQEDEEPDNNSFDTVLYVDPSHKLPYMQDFEAGSDFWRTEGINSSFELGVPVGGVIHTTPSGVNAWVTNLDGDYHNDEESYLLGPCFDFTGIDYPVFECKIFVHTEGDKDGVKLEYSSDNGQTWTRIGDLGDGDEHHWNWYNSDVIAGIGGGHGWTGEESSWKTARFMLDTLVFRNASGMKFRFHFASDAFGRREGIGIDDIYIYDAPRDIGVVSVEYPVTGCAQDIGEHVEVTIKNFGLDTLLRGDSLILGYDFDGKATVMDTLVLQSDLLRGGTLPYTFTKRLSVSTSGMKEVKVFGLLSDDIDFYNDTLTNDTTSKSIEVTLTPFVNLPHSIHTVRPDTIILNAYTGEPNDDYIWQDGSDDSAFQVTTMADGLYHVTALNAFCSYRDTTYVYRLIADVGITGLTAPASDCELGIVSPTLLISNFGTDTIDPGDEIPVRYKVDSGTVIEETALASEIIYPGDTMEFTFSGTSDMSEVKSYDLVMYTELPYDDTLANDTLKSGVQVFGITEIDLGPDTMVRSLEYVLDAGPGYDSYQWQDGSLNRTYTADSTGQYRVTVSEGAKCPNSDSVNIIIIIPDIALERISNPLNSCGLSVTENLDIYVVNSGTDTLQPGDTIAISYQINTGTVMKDTLFVNHRVEPEDSVLFSSTKTIDMSGEGSYQFAVTAEYTADLKLSNNNLDQTVEMWGYPVVSLGDDRTVTSKRHTLDAGDGFTSYLWQDGSTEREFIIIYEDRSSDSLYSVTVTDDKGCEGHDEVRIIFDISDLALRSVLSPTSACEMMVDEELLLVVINNGTKTIVNEQLKVIASLNGGIDVTGQKNLTVPLEPGDSLEFLFGHKFDFSGIGDHDLVAYTILASDADPGNDTLHAVISHYGAPPIDIGGISDTVRTTLPHSLNAGADYATYIWNGILGNRSHIADRFGWHILEVTDLRGCHARDSAYLAQSTGLGEILLPGELRIYPVPANNKLYVEYHSGQAEQLIMEIFDPRGSKVYLREYLQANEIIEMIDVSRMSEGIYFLRLRSSGRQLIKRIVIQ